MTFARIAGIGSYLPENVVTNRDLEKTMDTSDEWIRERTGIERRHIAGDDETTSSMGLEAAKRAMDAHQRLLDFTGGSHIFGARHRGSKSRAPASHRCRASAAAGCSR